MLVKTNNGKTCADCAQMEQTCQPHAGLKDLFFDDAVRGQSSVGRLLFCLQCGTLWKRKGSENIPLRAVPSDRAFQ
jgi:hypothetical protein